jgi:hypothetical protein
MPDLDLPVPLHRPTERNRPRVIYHTHGLQLRQLSLDPLALSPEAPEGLGRSTCQLDIVAGAVAAAETATFHGRVS